MTMMIIDHAGDHGDENDSNDAHSENLSGSHLQN